MKNILVVDDDIVMIKLLELQLRRAGLRGVCFQDSGKALAGVDTVEPAVAVLDYNMPGMNGVALLQALRERGPNAALPVIFITGEADQDVLDLIEKTDNARLLAKPFSPRKVITLIEELLASCESPDASKD